MVSRRVQLPISVVEAANKRIINAFSNGVNVYLTLSGGKDSIVLADLVYQLARQGRIDVDLLKVVFIDEEAIFDDVEKIVKDWRRRFLAVGAEVRWYCIEVTHFNCFNSLTEEETFICWDSECSDRWVRRRPSFAITDHPLLKPRRENYQSFLAKATADGITMTGLRLSESVQRLMSFRQDYSKASQMFSPLYDWKDSDIWLYIQEHELEFPATYMHLYQTGRSRRQMRISQFFSIDTAQSLVKLAEYEPDLMERVQRREPNAYLAALYWDTEMFRRAGGSGESRSSADGEGNDRPDYKALTFERMNSPEQLSTKEGRRLAQRFRRSVVSVSTEMNESDWKKAYGMLIGGDPKDRTLRGIMANVKSRRQGS